MSRSRSSELGDCERRVSCSQTRDLSLPLLLPLSSKKKRIYELLRVSIRTRQHNCNRTSRTRCVSTKGKEGIEAQSRVQTGTEISIPSSTQLSYLLRESRYESRLVSESNLDVDIHSVTFILVYI
ncbi:uncharacterized protein LOC116850008 [Odontomachus brunneus]|uniref:uncharacterized protein LOC116850008 n=1 Tax=Odontomachus brunneus TaxID=486640 RepID=UPI0013F247C7|nr:uncharacterized protein LOC116850008 [Odontomachus brunneus]